MVRGDDASSLCMVVVASSAGGLSLDSASAGGPRFFYYWRFMFHVSTMSANSRPRSRVIVTDSLSLFPSRSDACRLRIVFSVPKRADVKLHKATRSFFHWVGTLESGRRRAGAIWSLGVPVDLFHSFPAMQGFFQVTCRATPGQRTCGDLVPLFRLAFVLRDTTRLAVFTQMQPEHSLTGASPSLLETLVPPGYESWIGSGLKSNSAIVDHLLL